VDPFSAQQPMNADDTMPQATDYHENSRKSQGKHFARISVEPSRTTSPSMRNAPLHLKLDSFCCWLLACRILAIKTGKLESVLEPARTSISYCKRFNHAM